MKRQRTTNRAQSWSLVLPQTVMTWTRTLHGCCSRWHMCPPDFMWVSAVGDSGRRAVILRAQMIGIIDASCRSVHHIFCHSGVRTRDSAKLAVLAVTSEWKMLTGQYPVHFSKSSCFDVLCHSLSLTFVSVEHIVCPATSTEISTITCSGEGFCLSKRTWVEGRPLGVRTSEYSSVC